MIVNRWRPLMLLVCCTCFCASAQADDLLPPTQPMQTVIDHYIDVQLKDAEVQPMPQVDDANLVRRLTLDLVGRIPTPAEVRQYSESTDPSKRHHLIERLISSSEFLAHQVNEFDTLLMYDSKGNLREYLTQAFKDQRSWDRIFRELLLATAGDQPPAGAEQFLKVRARDADRLTNDVSMLFFGVNISCTQCHDHPLVPDWKQDHFFGLKSFFNRTFENGGFLAERDYGLVTYKTPKGEDRQAKLMFLSGTLVDEPAATELTNDQKKQETKQLKEWADKKVAPPAPKFSRRAQLIDVALRPGENRFLARSIVNRLWYRLIGYGLVMPVDQMHSENPPSHPELMDWLARDQVENGFDLTRLVRGIVASQTYSRSSRVTSGEPPSPELFAAAQIRPLSPFQFAASIKLATTNSEQFGSDRKPADVERQIKSEVNNSRGLADLFDMPQESFQVSVTESLLFSNGDRLLKELSNDSKDRLLGQLGQLKDRPAQIDAAVWAVLSRAPQADEAKLLDAYLAKRADRSQQALAQMIWALVTCAEFRFNY